MALDKYFGDISDEEKLEILRNDLSKLSMDDIKEIIKNAIKTEDAKIKILELFWDEIQKSDDEDDNFSYDTQPAKETFTEVFINLAESIHGNDPVKRLNLLEYFEEVLEKRYWNDWDDTKFDYYSSVVDAIEELDAQTHTVLKKEKLSQYQNRISGSDIARIICSFDYWVLDEESEDAYRISQDEIKLELLKQYASELGPSNIAYIMRSFADDNIKLKVFEEYKSKFVMLNDFSFAIRAIDDINEKFKILDETLLFEKSRSSNIRVEDSDVNGFVYDSLMNCSDEGKIIALEKYSNYLSDAQKLFLIFSMNDDDIRRDTFCLYGFDKGREGSKDGLEKPLNYKVALAAYWNLDESVFANPENLRIVSDDFCKLIGEEYAYKLLKHVVVATSKNEVDLKKILENPEGFAKYLKFRERFESKESFSIQRIEAAIEEYKGNEELFEEASSREITDKQMRILEAIFREKINYRTEDREETYIEMFDETHLYRATRVIKDAIVERLVDSADKIEDYPRLRKEYFDAKIDNYAKNTTSELPTPDFMMGYDIDGELYKKVISISDDDPTTELLLGITSYEYKKILFGLKSHRLSEELEKIVDSLPEETKKRVSQVIVAAKITELVIEIQDEEVKKDILRAFNEDLSNEFENGGSSIANVRKSMQGIRQELNNFLGDELAEALYIDSESCEREMVEDVEVIHLQGEKFKMLVHVIDAYNEGTGHFEEWERGNSFLCTSLISDEFMKHVEGKQIVGFTHVNPRAFIQSGAADLNSYANINSLEVSAKKNLEYQTTSQVIKKSAKQDTYSEYNLYREVEEENGEIEKTIPNMIICFDEVDEDSINEAKRISEVFGLEKPLPIYVIHKEKYSDRITAFRKQAMAEKDEKTNASIDVNDLVIELLKKSSSMVTTEEITNAQKALIEAAQKRDEIDV